MGRIWHVLQYSGAYLALIAGLEVLIVQNLLSLPLSTAPLIGMFVTFAVYANDRLVDEETDAISNPRRTAFVSNHRDALYVLGALTYGVAGMLAALAGPLAFGITVMPGLIWIVYAVEFIPVPDLPIDRLKEMVVLNSLLVSAAWSLHVVLLPVAIANEPLAPIIWLLLAYFVLATFVNAEIANARDVDSDLRAGVSTIPSVIGLGGARVVLFALTVLTTGILGLAVFAGVVSVRAALALSLGPVGLAVILSLLSHVETGRLSIAAEFTRLPVFLLLLLYLA